MKDRIFGPIQGHEVGATFANRAELAKSGIHKPTQAGISGSQVEGADSIVLSGGYEDDEDHGEVIIYTGHGGQDEVSREQIADQELTRQNLALAISAQQGLPVRVVRGAGHDSLYSPSEGYQYAGIYRVERFWHEPGLSGHQVYRFRLVRTEETELEEAPPKSLPTGGGTKKPGRIKVSTTRVIRDTTLSRRLKGLYDYTCQVCGLRLEGAGGPYAEAAHIRPLGRPHDGPDTYDNLLCLCPNHHYLFDFGAFGIDDDLNLIGLDGALRLHRDHKIERSHLQYHRARFRLLDSANCPV